MVCSRILNFASMIFVEEMCVVALAPMIIMVSDSTFHPLLVGIFNN